MDKYEYKIKLAQIEKLVNKKDYVTAAKIADGVDWRKVKSVTTLTMIADIYEENERLEDCYEILTMIYDRSPIARSIIYRLAELSVKMHDFEEAIDFYKDFVRIAPNDPRKYILKYQICREQGSSVSDQITILQEFKNQEYDDRWAYELACLYEEAGMIDGCIEECDELILWFSEGEYVTKALELKMKYQELTAAQKEKYEHRFDTGAEDGVEPPEVQEPVIEEPAEKTEPEEIEPEPEKIEPEETEPEPTETVLWEKPEVIQAEEKETEKKEEAEPEETVHVSDVNTGKFSTINLQRELAKGLQFILAEIQQETAQSPKDEASAEESAEPEEAVKEEMAAEPEKMPVVAEKISETAELRSEILKYTSEEHPLTMEEMLCVEEDGQLSLNIEEDSLEKQITGQMSIEEILEAWEEKKHQEKVQAEANGEPRSPVLCETGEITNLLNDFIPRMPKDVQHLPEPEVEEPAKPAVTDEVPEFEDDLPMEIDFEDAIVGFLEQPENGETAEEAVEPEETETKSVTSDTVSMIDAIEKALAFETTPTETLGRYLTDEEEKIFAYFTSVKGMKKQLVTLLGEDFRYAGRKDSAEGNLIITGHPGNGKTTLAIDIVKAFQKQRQEKGGKLAKVTGDGLNKKEPGNVIKKLGGGAMIIERAGALNSETVAKLSNAMEEETGGLLVILEDAKAEINSLLKQNVGFAAKFNRSIDIPIFSNDELVAFGKSYAEEYEYYFDELAVLALYDSIGVRQTSDHVVNITEVKELVDNAMIHADKKSRGLFAKISRKRIDEYGNKLLLEEDFES